MQRRVDKVNKDFITNTTKFSSYTGKYIRSVQAPGMFRGNQEEHKELK